MTGTIGTDFTQAFTLQLIKTLKSSRQTLALQSEPDNSGRDTEIQKLEQRVEALKVCESKHKNARKTHMHISARHHRLH